MSDKRKVSGWIRAMERGEHLLVPEGGGGIAPGKGATKAEKLAWEKQQRGEQHLPTVLSDATIAANAKGPARDKATAGSIPGSINWAIKPVSVTIQEAGKVGVTWVPVRDAKTGSEAVTIESIAAGGQMDQIIQGAGLSVCPGMALSKAGGQAVNGMSYSEVIEAIQSFPRPLALVFSGVAKDTADEIQLALTNGGPLPASADTDKAFHEMAGQSKVAANIGDKKWEGNVGRKRTARPVIVT